MVAATVPTVFISHAHVDKRVARRISRRLIAYGAKPWLDERELRVGAALTSSIRNQIDRASVFLVVASRSAAQSDWVRQEIGFARERRKTVVPVFIEPLAKHELFKDTLGVNATYPPGFASVLDTMIVGLFQSLEIEAPKPNKSSLTAGLRDLVGEEPDLAPLIQNPAGMHATQMETVFGAEFHPLDEALNTLLELRSTSHVAHHAALGFARQGAGMSALFLWIALTGNGGLPLTMAVGSEQLQPELLPAAITLLGACRLPNNQALYNFIARNADTLNDAQRRDVIRLVTWPTRSDTSDFGDVLGWVALKAFPDVSEIQQLWTRWILGGVFDGAPSSPRTLASYLADASKEGLPSLGMLTQALRDHFRSLMRSCEKNKISCGVDHLQAAADEGTPVLGSLLAEAKGAVASAEWKDWTRSDPETAEWMSQWIYSTVDQAYGERDWLKAIMDVDEILDVRRRLRRIQEEEDL